MMKHPLDNPHPLQCLEPTAKFTREQALELKENFEDNGVFHLVKCPVCKRDNYALAVLSGVCGNCFAMEE
jgi:hypothetical protein